MNTSLDPKRTVAELKELRARTADADGAHRVAFTPAWVAARAFLSEKLAAMSGVEVHTDAAGNLWATLPGDSERALLIGGHLDSVPNGGWLDGCFNVFAGLEILRRVHAQFDGRPPLTVRLVDWADEEGARFGKSLFGSSACSGNLDSGRGARPARPRRACTCPTRCARHGVDFERVKESGRELAHAAAYIELHIEQGPVLLDLDLPLGTVLGTFGVERHAMTFHGQAAHSGSTPMNRRRDAFLAAGRMASEIYTIAERHGGVCTIGSCTTKPGIVTSVVEACRITPRSAPPRRPGACAHVGRCARPASERFAREGNVTVIWERLWNIAPRPFHPESARALRRGHRGDGRAGASAAPRVRCTTRPKSPARAYRR